MEGLHVPSTGHSSAKGVESLKSGLEELATLRIDTLLGSQHTLSLPTSSSMAELYSAVGDECGVEPENIALSLGTKEIPRRGLGTLASLGIQTGAHIRVSPRIESGLFKHPPRNTLEQDVTKALKDAMQSIDPQDVLAQLLQSDGDSPACFEVKVGGDALKVEVSLASESHRAQKQQEQQVKNVEDLPFQVLQARAARGQLTAEERTRLQRHYCEDMDRRKDNASLQSKLDRLKQKRAEAKARRRRGPQQRSDAVNAKSVAPAVPKTKQARGVGAFLGLKRGFLLK